jgi:predicted aminopeptidase
MAVLGGTGLAVVLATACLLGGCAQMSYLSQSVSGHLDLVNRAKPVSEWTADPNTTSALKARLELSQRMRDFAVSELKLPDNKSYRQYADLGRRAAVWNVVAAPPLSLKLERWCFPVVGCVSYRGYYDEAQAQTFAASLRDKGLEASAYPVPAYSTLGKLEWLGGDPLLNTFVNQNEAELARLIFHELAHQVVFAPGDTAFNESFATAVERLGLQRWLDRHGTQELKAQVQRNDGYRAEFRAIVKALRSELEALYARTDMSDDAKRAEKQAIFERLRADHRERRAGRWAQVNGFDGWIERANNATVGIAGAYSDLVPAFEKLFEREGRDFVRFYAAVEQLAALSTQERKAQLERLER